MEILITGKNYQHFNVIEIFYHTLQQLILSDGRFHHMKKTITISIINNIFISYITTLKWIPQHLVQLNQLHKCQLWLKIKIEIASLDNLV